MKSFRTRLWLQALRSATNRTQAAIASESSISQQFYQAIESGQRRPSPEVAKQLARVLSFDWTRFYDEVALEDQQTQEEVI